MARAPNLDVEIDRLYAGLLTEFVGERNELAKRLRTAGDREAATSVKALAKPSLTAWVVNRLHHAHPDAVAELMAAGERIRAAHLSDPAALGDAVEAHRSALADLVELARETLEAAGHPAGKAQIRRITGTLEALAAIDPESLGVTPGRLVRDLEPPGFGAFGAAFPAPAPTKGRSGARRAAAPAARRGRKAATEAKAEAAKADVERKKSAALRRRISAAEAKRQRAAEKAREAERALRAAEKALKAADRGAERKRRRAKEAEREAARAEKDADLARAALRKARERDESARETLEARETELASLKEWLASS